MLYVALAGQHQIWKHLPSTRVTNVFSGDGAERNANGATGRTTSWAQPSGLSLSGRGDSLFVADSESSCIRRLSLQDGGSEVCCAPVFGHHCYRLCMMLTGQIAGEFGLRGIMKCLKRTVIHLAWVDRTVFNCKWICAYRTNIQ